MLGEALGGAVKGSTVGSHGGSSGANTISCHFSMIDNTLLPEVWLRAFLVNIIFFGIFKVRGIARPHQPAFL